MSFLVLVVDDEPDVEMLFRQQFRRDLRDNRFKMDFAQSAASALQRISDAALRASFQVAAGCSPYPRPTTRSPTSRSSFRCSAGSASTIRRWPG